MAIQGGYIKLLFKATIELLHTVVVKHGYGGYAGTAIQTAV